MSAILKLSRFVKYLKMQTITRAAMSTALISPDNNKYSGRKMTNI